MKNYLSYLKRVSALALLAIGCCTVSCSDDENTDEPDPVLEAKVTLAAGEATENSLSFTLTPENAVAVYYAVLTADTTLPSAEELFNASEWGSRPADATQSILYSWENLRDNTAYKVVAAARNAEGYSALATLDMQTLEKPFVQEEAKVGDFYYSDGTWSTNLDPNKTPIAIVFYTGLASEFGDSLAHYKDREGNPMSRVNGYAVALQDATYLNGTHSPVGWTEFSNMTHCGSSLEIDDFLGYSNTVAIKASAELRFGGLSPEAGNYPACYYATMNYEHICPSPAQSSGWFFPSGYQMKYIYDYAYFDTGNVLGCLERSFELLGDKAQAMYVPDAEYWTSTEQIDSYGDSCRALYITFGSNYMSAGALAWYNKNAEMRVRSVLVF